MIVTEIKIYLQEHGITQAFLCSKTGINKAKMSSILNNKSKLTVETYRNICEALGVDMNFFNPDDKEG